MNLLFVFLMFIGLIGFALIIGFLSLVFELTNRALENIEKRDRNENA